MYTIKVYRFFQVLLSLWILTGLVNLGSSSCGYSNCPSTDHSRINVHLVAHTHDDVGWLKTVDQYYYGTRKRDSSVGVQHILDSVIPQLVVDKTKRFIYVEMSFFSKWWAEQDERIKSIVRSLVNEGRLEFINGGWCMNDEATVTYHSTIEQMTLGLRFLNESFGSCAHPKVGWQIDPFGHTNEQASLFAQFGFDGMFFTRISFEDKQHRISNKSLDLIWHGDRALADQTGSIFTNIFRDGYDAPSGFCFDTQCLDDNLVDNKRSREYNIDFKGLEYIEYIRKYSKSKLTNHVLIPMGGDFQYSAAGQNFKNIDKLIKYVRSVAPDINIFYSTPSCYQYAVYQSIKHPKGHELRLPEKYNDFMPYDSLYTIWWSGYFSSRPSVKLVERQTANLLQVARQVSLSQLIKNGHQNGGPNKWIAEVRDHEAKCLMPLWEILGDLQHHDAITGTEKQHVADDYIRRAYEAWTVCSKFIGDTRRADLDYQLKKSGVYQEYAESGKRFKLNPVYLEDTVLCPLLNISQCDPIEAEVDFKKYLSNVNHPEDKSSHVGPTINKRTKRAPKSTLDSPVELMTKSVLLNVYNSLAKPVIQHDIRVPCNGRCDLDKVQVIQLSTNETMKLIRLPVPAGIIKLPFRDAITNYEVLFYANIPPLGYTSFVLEDTNDEEIVDEEKDQPDSIVVNEDARALTEVAGRNSFRSRKMRRSHRDKDAGRYEYFEMASHQELSPGYKRRTQRDIGASAHSTQSGGDRVIIKFDLQTGMIAGLKRASDGSVLNITQKFGYYFPSRLGTPAGAYTFRPNTTDPYLLEKPIMYKMFKRKDGALIEIHQKWADWIWQTIRVDARKNYIEFDYVIGPIPITDRFLGREVITRYITGMSNAGVFLTDSNGRQMLPRHRLRSILPEQLGGSFYPVVSTLALHNTKTTSGRPTAEAVAIMVDRPQAGTSLHEGQMEFLVHRRTMQDDSLGVSEPLDEPGEDGRGLVTRGQHRLYLKFQDTHSDGYASGYGASKMRKNRTQMFKLPGTPKENIDYEKSFAEFRAHHLSNPHLNLSVKSTTNYLVHDSVYDDLNLEFRRGALKPIVTFDRLRVTANEFLEMLGSETRARIKTDSTLLNNSLPNNVQLLTLQPWMGSTNEILIRFENLNNPLTLHPFPDYEAYTSLVDSYSSSSDVIEVDEAEICPDKARPIVEFDIEYLIKKIRIVSLIELTLGANVRLQDDKRLNWTDEPNSADTCQTSDKPTSVALTPRQIRTYLARFEFI